MPRKLGHFRQQSSPFEVIEFDSDRGKEMCGVVGVMACSRCRGSVLRRGVEVGVCCVGCGKEGWEGSVAVVEVWG